MRSLDEDAGTIRFSGHDGVNEIRFLMELPALERIAGIGKVSDNAYLTAFDQRRELIQTAAGRAYQRSRKSLIRLTASDF